MEDDAPPPIYLKSEFSVIDKLFNNEVYNNNDKDGYKLSKGKRFKFGVGIYSTPSIECAKGYAIKFKKDGFTYLIFIQNRVNPKSLIKIPKLSTKDDEYWVTPNESDIRPYGICIKKLKN